MTYTDEAFHRDSLAFNERMYGQMLASAIRSAITWCESGAEPMVAIAALKRTLAEYPPPEDELAEIEGRAT